ncbi:MAG: YdcF family protein [Desulfobacterales bacterium]|nr:YdcF family protein [Desulfobacterales bacterium]
MFTLQKLVKPFLWPPGIFILLLLGGGIGYWARRRIGSALACLVIALVFWVTAVSPMADLLLRPLERRYDRTLPTAGDVIVMLGAAIHAGARDMDGTGAPSAEACERLLATARLHRRTGLPIILAGGRVYDHQSMMGPVYRRFLVDLGIPPDRIILEDRSRNTYENARFSWELCRRRGFRRPLVVTHAVHMPRAMFCFRKLGIPARPVPCGFRTWEGKEYHWPDFLPRSFDGVAAALHEYWGLWAYRWQYGDVDSQQ